MRVSSLNERSEWAQHSNLSTIGLTITVGRSLLGTKFQPFKLYSQNRLENCPIYRGPNHSPFIGQELSKVKLDI